MSEIIWNTEEPPHKFRFYNTQISKNTFIYVWRKQLR